MGEALAGGVESGEICEDVEFRDSNVAKGQGGHWVASYTLRFIPEDAANKKKTRL